MSTPSSQSELTTVHSQRVRRQCTRCNGSHKVPYSTLQSWKKEVQNNWSLGVSDNWAAKDAGGTIDASPISTICFEGRRCHEISCSYTVMWEEMLKRANGENMVGYYSNLIVWTSAGEQAARLPVSLAACATGCAARFYYTSHRMVLSRKPEGP